MVPHVHLSGINALVTFLFIVAAFGSIKMFALSHPNNSAAQAWLALF